MDIPREAYVGARKGLLYCLVGLISQKRYSSQVLHPVHREFDSTIDSCHMQLLWHTFSVADAGVICVCQGRV